MFMYMIDKTFPHLYLYSTSGKFYSEKNAFKICTNVKYYYKLAVWYFWAHN